MSERAPQSHDIIMRPLHLIQVARGIKTIESRANTPAMKRIREGHAVRFIDRNDQTLSVQCSIAGRFEYPTVEEMLEIEGIDAVLPGVESLRSAITIFEETPDYRDLERQYGVVALLLERPRASRALFNRIT